MHAAAWFVLDLQPQDHVTAARQMLHWLPVRQRIMYKLCVLVHEVAFGYKPTYLQHAAIPFLTLPGRGHLRSADSGQCNVPSHVCRHRSAPERFQLPDRKPVSDFPHHSGTVCATFKKHLKQYFSWRLTTSYCFIFSPYAFYILLLSATFHFTVNGAVEIFWSIDWIESPHLAWDKAQRRIMHARKTNISLFVINQVADSKIPWELQDDGKKQVGFHANRNGMQKL